MSQPAYRCAPKVTILLLFRACNRALALSSSACLLPAASRLKSLGRFALFFVANSFESAVFRGTLSDEREKF
jgi:hypothetical protein